MPETNLTTIELIPYIRRKEVLFYAKGLRPDKVANTFFDETSVNDYCQVGNKLLLTAAATGLNQNDGLVCSTTNAFAKVITVSNNIVYLNENFITFNIAAYNPGPNSLSSADYTTGDIVYQTSNTTNTNITANIFVGRIEYYNHANGVLSVYPLSGTANVASGSNTIYKINGTVLSNTTSVVQKGKYTTGATVYNPLSPSVSGTISSYVHASGAVPSVNVGNNSVVRVQANTPSSVVGNTLYITAGTGLGQKKVISEVTDNTEIRVASAWTTTPDSTSKYSIGNHIVDDFGTLAGIFQLPEETSIRFLTGERVFTITDASSPYDETSSIFATAKYVAMGTIGGTLVQQQQQVSPDNPTASGSVITQSYNIPPAPVDLTVENGEGLYGNIVGTLPKTRRYPLAQTFSTPEPTSVVAAGGGNPAYVKQDYGMFITSVDLFFKSKPDDSELQLPVGLYIVETINGFPSDKVLGYKVLDCSQVKTSTTPDSANSSTKTKFTFPDPIYIAPKTEYAMVIGTESPDYEVWISELGGVVTGSNPERRVSEQPYTGSLFKSQNASTWSPFQNEDLMFIIHKAVFDTANKAYVSFTPQGLQRDIFVDSITLLSTERNFKPTKSLYRMRSTVEETGAVDTDGIVLIPNKRFNLGEDLKISSKSSKRRRIIKKSNANSFIINIEFSTADVDVSPIINLERLGVIAMKNEVDNANIASADIIITNGGGLHANAANIQVTISAPDDAAGTQATANVLASQLVSGNVTGVNIIEGGAGYYTSPTITLAEPSISTNATATIAGEEGSKFGKVISAKYISKEVRLAEGFDAGDLRVYIDAIRPLGTNIDVYYKVLSRHDSDKFSDKTWQRMEKYSYPSSVDQQTIVELQFRPSLEDNRLSYTEGGVAYPLGGTFRSFAIKITLTAGDTTVIPIVKNYRAIATPAG